MVDDFPKTLSKTAGVPETFFFKQKLHLDSLYFSENTLMLTEPRGGYNHLHLIFRLLPLVQLGIFPCSGVWKYPRGRGGGGYVPL